MISWHLSHSSDNYAKLVDLSRLHTSTWTWLSVSDYIKLSILFGMIETILLDEVSEQNPLHDHTIA